MYTVKYTRKKISSSPSEKPYTRMTPKTLSISSLSPFLILHQFKTPNRTTNILKLHNPETSTTLLLCKSIPEQARPILPLSPEPQGTGAAAPTRGDVFLQRQQSLEAAAKVLPPKKKKKKWERRGAYIKATSHIISCYGCGAPLQTFEADAPGYVEPETYELKKRHRQLRAVLCGRCRLLSHGHMITAVGGHGGYAGGKQFVTAEELREKLSHLRYEKALIVKLVDIVDFNGSFLGRVRDLVGANPIILVVTKVDLLPKGTDFDCVGDWVVEATAKKKLNVISVHLTSSKSLVGIAGVIAEIQKEKKARDVYILGSANVGKSAFINASLKMMSDKDPVAAMARRYKPVQSAVPGTTVGPIQIDAFLGHGKLYDTPGIHLHHRQAAVVHTEDLPLLAPRSRLTGQPITTQVALETWVTEKTETDGLNGFSIFWGGLVRVDIMKVLPETRLTFYGPRTLKLHIVPTEKADDFYTKEVGNLLTPPTGKERADEWKGLGPGLQFRIKFEDATRPACDVAISGLGWIAVEPVSRSLKTLVETMESNSIKTSGELILNVHVPKPVETFIRPPLPVGKAGAEWYRYRDLSEKEEETRPKWHF